MSEIKDQLPDLSGKCVSITTKSSSINHDLSDPSFEYQGGRLFIVGVVPKGATESNWVAGCKGAVAWDQVTDYYVFENLWTYQKAINIVEKTLDSNHGYDE